MKIHKNKKRHSLRIKFVYPFKFEIQPFKKKILKKIPKINYYYISTCLFEKFLQKRPTMVSPSFGNVFIYLST